MAAFLGGALLLVTRAIKAHKVYQEIDVSLLSMFVGLLVAELTLKDCPIPAYPEARGS